MSTYYMLVIQYRLELEPASFTILGGKCIIGLYSESCHLPRLFHLYNSSQAHCSHYNHSPLSSFFLTHAAFSVPQGSLSGPFSFTNTDTFSLSWSNYQVIKLGVHHNSSGTCKCKNNSDPAGSECSTM